MAKRKYRQVSETTRLRMSKAHKGKKHPQKTKDLISKSMIEYWQSVPDNPFTETIK